MSTNRTSAALTLLAEMDSTKFRPLESTTEEREEHWHRFERGIHLHFTAIASKYLRMEEALQSMKYPEGHPFVKRTKEALAFDPLATSSPSGL